MPTSLQRTTYAMPRAAEYFQSQELRMMTGQPSHKFGTVVLKELVDNAIDACEHADALRTYDETKTTPTVALTWGPAQEEAEHLILTVADNGRGMSEAVVQSILDFTTRTSDKAIYRSPTRGAQGNAFKTIVGIPYALGLRAPVVIESQGLRHAIAVDVDPAGGVHIHPELHAVPSMPGTRISVPLPLSSVDPRHWARAFTLFNPHVAVKICQGAHGELPCSLADDGCGDFYRASVQFPGTWRKYLPSDHTSAHWYRLADLERLIFAKINAQTQGQEPEQSLRDFVMEFRGLTGTGPAKRVCAEVPGVSRLRDFMTHKAAILALHDAMKVTAKAPSADVLGMIGADHFKHWFDQWYGVKRFWYERKVVLGHGGIPCIVEAALADTEAPGLLWTGTNFSPTFEPPLSETFLDCGKVWSQGLPGLLRALHVHPAQDGRRTAIAFHLSCPALEFADRGKIRFETPTWMVTMIEEALGKVTKTLYSEEKRRLDDAAAAVERELAQEKHAIAQQKKVDEAERKAAPKPMTMKEAVFLVMQAAWEHATGSGSYRISKRGLFYAVRERVQEHTPETLEIKYFTSTLLPTYEREHGELPGVYAESRGVFHEPHADTETIVSDSAVASYRFPDYVFNKILYIEKRTVWPILESSRLAERYDMAILTGEGYATEAMHALFRSASKDKQYQLFVLHDADPDGYNIARLLQEESANMRGKGYAVEVMDLGLFFEDALALGITPETFLRKKSLQQGLVLSEEARQAFEGTPVKGKTKEWTGRRVELNALSAPQLVDYIERRLAACGASGKVIPPDPVLTGRLRSGCVQRIATMVQREVESLLSLGTITENVQRAFHHLLPATADRATVEAALAKYPTQEWGAPLWAQALHIVWPHCAAITAAVRQELLDTIQRGALDAHEDPSQEEDDETETADDDEGY
jgi:hypothetical protein